MKNILLVQKELEFPKLKYDYVGYAADDNIVNYYRYYPNYLCFTALLDSTISLTNKGDNAPILYYSTDKNNFTQWDYSSISIKSGDKIYMYGDNPEGFSSSTSKYSKFSMTGKIEASGNLQTLLSKDEPDEIPCGYCFYYIFNDCTALVTAPELPATKLNGYCYSGAFSGSGLTVAPDLPATEVIDGCYMFMFMACNSLTTAPETLPAMTLYRNCYAYMFDMCGKLTKSPDLPATTVAYGCYNFMFYNCYELTDIPSILPATELQPYCYAYMFSSCYKITTAPVLPAINLIDNCYGEMFLYCHSLNYVKALFVTDPIVDNWHPYTYNWLVDTASTGTFVQNAAATWTAVQYDYGTYPYSWTLEKVTVE